MKSGIKKKGDAIRRIETVSRRIRGAHVKVGVIGGAAHDIIKVELGGRNAKGQFQKNKIIVIGKGLRMAELAAIHEFGVPEIGIPERSFIRAGVHGELDVLKGVVRRGVRAMLAGQITERQALNLLGLAAQRAIQRKFRDGSLAPNAPATVRAKGSSVPLIDTGQLRASISYAIIGAKDE